SQCQDWLPAGPVIVSVASRRSTFAVNSPSGEPIANMSITRHRPLVAIGSLQLDPAFGMHVTKPIVTFIGCGMMVGGGMASARADAATRAGSKQDTIATRKNLVCRIVEAIRQLLRRNVPRPADLIARTL